jgi:predicted DNA-binding transcriptional regulator YafY
MPANRNALIRYQTIDKCLQNRYRKWTLEDLIEAVSEALYEFEGNDNGVSKRTIQADIQMMRSEKLGYNAPIVVIDKKYYVYGEPKYSITNIPLTDHDLQKLKEVTEILRQFKGFNHFQDLIEITQRLEDKIYSAKTQRHPIIDFEKNENLKGLEYIEHLYKAILNKKTLEIQYKSFKARSDSRFVFHPYLLKEYRNRWFVLGKREDYKPNLSILALDRILSIENHPQSYKEYPKEKIEEYFKNIIGVTFSPNVELETVILRLNKDNAPYLITKPLHHSQRILEEHEEGIVIEIKVQLNFELEREILGFGEGIEVLSPEKLKKRINYRIRKMQALYGIDSGNSAS